MSHAIIFCTFACLLVLIARPAGAENVALTGDPFPPYVEGEVGKEATGGIAVELVQAIFERIEGVTVSFPMLPWKRALSDVEKGTKDGIVMLLKTAQRERYMRYTEPLIISSNLIWYSEERFPKGFNWQRTEDLKPYRIGKTRGYSYGEELDQALDSGAYNVVEVRAPSQLFTMLSQDRIDFALANDAVGYALAERHAPEGSIVPASKPTGTDVHYLSLSKASPAVRLIPEINRILAELRETGVVDQILRGR